MENYKINRYQNLKIQFREYKNEEVEIIIKKAKFCNNPNRNFHNNLALLYDLTIVCPD